MRTSLLLLAFAGLALAGLAPTAQAQMPGPQYNIVLSLTPPGEPLQDDHHQLVMRGRVDFVGDPTMALNTEGVPIQYTITKAPAWLTVVVSPATDVIPLAFGSPVTGSRTFTVTAQATGMLDASVVDIVEITVTASPTSPLSQPKSASQGVPVQFYVHHEDEDDCDDHAAATATADAKPASEEATAPQDPGHEPLTIQSGGVTPMGTWYAVGGFVLVGAGVGLLLRRRLNP